LYIARNWDVSSSFFSLSLARSDSLVKQHRGHQLDGVRSESVVERSGGGGGLQRLGGEETHLGRLQRRRQIFLESDEPEFEGIRFEAFLFVSGGFSGCKREGDEPSRGVPDRVARESGRRRGKSNEGKARLSPPIEGGTRRHFILASTSLDVSSHRIAGAARGAAGRDALVAVATQAGTTREAAREAEVCMGRGMQRGWSESESFREESKEVRVRQERNFSRRATASIHFSLWPPAPTQKFPPLAAFFFFVVFFLVLNHDALFHEFHRSSHRGLCRRGRPPLNRRPDGALLEEKVDGGRRGPAKGPQRVRLSVFFLLQMLRSETIGQTGTGGNAQTEQKEGNCGQSIASFSI